MSNLPRLLVHTGVLLFALCTNSVANAAYADPSGRVAHLNDVQGDVSYSPAGEDEWIRVVRNRPLIRGDRLWTDREGRAEFQVGSAAIRLGSNTSVEFLELSDRIAQVQLTQGTLNLRVRRLHSGQIFEVATPTLAFTINRAGRYRIDADPYNNHTTVVVWEGRGEAYGENASFPLRTGDTVRFYDTDLRDYEIYGLPREDDFDRYSLARDRRLDRSASLRYLDDDVVGYSDLDEYGDWRPVRSYGDVWFPSRVAANWAPYRDGHWVWQEPWGWTWVDNAPWGFAPSHYGRWVSVSNRWGWIPGPRNVRPVYAPALVAFVGGSGWSLSISLGDRSSPIGWFPLGPREVYVPSYQTSRDYFTRVNVNNTVINNTTITNVYNNYSGNTVNVNQVIYANRAVAGAVTVVPSTVFVSAQPVAAAAIRLDKNAVATAEITRVAAIAPIERSVIGAGEIATVRPAKEVFNRRVVARNAPPPGEQSFAVRKQQLQKNPGWAPEAVQIAPMEASNLDTTQNVLVIDEQQNTVDTRAAGSSRPDRTDRKRPLDRTADTENASRPGGRDRNQDADRQGREGAQQTAEQPKTDVKPEPSEPEAVGPRIAEPQSQEQVQRNNNDERQATERQPAEQQQQRRQRNVRDERQAAERKAAEQQAAEQQAAEQQAAEEQAKERQAAEQQAAQKQAKERQANEQQQERQRQRNANNAREATERQAAEQQATERQAAEQQAAEKQAKERQANEQQQERQRQRNASNAREATERQAAEQQATERQANEQQQERQRQRNANNAREATERQAAEQQAAEQQATERQANEQQQERQRQRNANNAREATERQAAEQQAAEREATERQAAEQQATERQATERQANEQQQERQRQRNANNQRGAAAERVAVEPPSAESAVSIDSKQQPVKQPVTRLTRVERQRLAECEREAARQNKDKSQCLEESRAQSAE